MIVAKMSRSRALGWSARGLLPLALPATVTVIAITLVARRRRRKPVAAAPAEDAGVSVPEQVGPLHYTRGHTCASFAFASRRLPLRPAARAATVSPVRQLHCFGRPPQHSRPYTAPVSLVGLAQPVVLVTYRACLGMHLAPQ